MRVKSVNSSGSSTDQTIQKKHVPCLVVIYTKRRMTHDDRQAPPGATAEPLVTVGHPPAGPAVAEQRSGRAEEERHEGFRTARPNEVESVPSTSDHQNHQNFCCW